MVNLVSAIRDTVPISQFNRGQAGKIFEDVRHRGAKVVMKNNAAECVLLSPEEYTRLMDEVNDARLLTLATERSARMDPSALLSQEEMLRRLGLEEKDLAGYEEVEFE